MKHPTHDLALSSRIYQLQAKTYRFDEAKVQDKQRLMRRKARPIHVKHLFIKLSFCIS